MCLGREGGRGGFVCVNKGLAGMFSHGVVNATRSFSKAFIRSRSKSDLEGYYESQVRT